MVRTSPTNKELVLDTVAVAVPDAKSRSLIGIGVGGVKVPFETKEKVVVLTSPSHCKAICPFLNIKSLLKACIILLPSGTDSPLG